MADIGGETGRGSEQRTKKNYVKYGNNAMSAQTLEMSLLGVEERCSISEGMRAQWSNDLGEQQMSTPPPS